MTVDLELGARVVDGGVRFRIWAPLARAIQVEISGERRGLVKMADDIFELTVPGVSAGTDYSIVIDDRPRPDPVSRSQPHGVHGPSRVVDPSTYRWNDVTWRGIPLDQYIIYELHVGTFTPAGTFAAAIEKLDHLVELGITAVELMPVAEFPGGRNWGYDGVCMFAPHSSYGGPDGLRALVDACHAHGLAVILDVVYNHVGPEGNYLGEVAPFFTSRYTTPWGAAMNLDGEDSDGVRRHLVTNAVAWFVEYHVDALRLDAIHGIFDHSPRHLLEELASAVQVATAGRHAYLIAESDLNDVRVIRPQGLGGFGLDAQWSDDFHHALRQILVSDARGYFTDFGEVAQLAKAITHTFVYDGNHSRHRKRKHGTSAVSYPGPQFVVYLQNHDQIANGSQGRRLTTVVGYRAHRLAATLALSTPNLPMLFMGEEFAESAPFLYFVSHSDPELVEAVREGRRRELADLAESAEPGSHTDPQAVATFQASKLDWSRVARAPHGWILALYRDLIALRRREACLSNGRKDLTRAWSSDPDGWLVVERRDPSGRAIIVANLRDRENRIPCVATPGSYRLALASDDPRYGGAGSSTSPELVIGAEPAVLVMAPHTARIYLGTP